MIFYFNDKARVEISLSFELCLHGFDFIVIFRRICDLNGSEYEPLPQLNNMRSLKTL